MVLIADPSRKSVGTLLDHWVVNTTDVFDPSHNVHAHDIQNYWELGNSDPNPLKICISLNRASHPIVKRVGRGVLDLLKDCQQSISCYSTPSFRKEVFTTLNAVLATVTHEARFQRVQDSRTHPRERERASRTDRRPNQSSHRHSIPFQSSSMTKQTR